MFLRKCDTCVFGGRRLLGHNLLSGYIKCPHHHRRLGENAAFTKIYMWQVKAQWNEMNCTNVMLILHSNVNIAHLSEMVTWAQGRSCLLVPCCGIWNAVLTATGQRGYGQGVRGLIWSGCCEIIWGSYRLCWHSPHHRTDMSGYSGFQCIMRKSASWHRQASSFLQPQWLDIVSSCFSEAFWLSVIIYHLLSRTEVKDRLHTLKIKEWATESQWNVDVWTLESWRSTWSFHGVMLFERCSLCSPFLSLAQVDFLFHV